MLLRFSVCRGPRPRIFTGVFYLLVLIVGCSFSAASVRAQDSRWTAHTSMREATAVDYGDGALWVATTGGVFSYAPASGEIRRFTIADGLHGIQVRSVAYDAQCGNGRACIWIGYRDGVIDRLDPQSQVVRSFRDIERAGRFPSREINRFVLQGDSLLVATAFGLVVFDAVKNEVRDSYTQFASLLPGTAVHDVTVAPGPDGADHLWLATDEGVATAPLQAVNLKDPGVWQVERSGLPSEEALSIAFFDEMVYVGTASGLARRRSDGTYASIGLTNQPVRDLEVTPDRLVGIDRSALFSVQAGGQARRMTTVAFQRPVGVAVDPEGRVWVGDEIEGVAEIASLPAPGSEIDVRRTFAPEGPFHNLFTSLTMDEAGNLWAGGTEGRGSGNGFYRMSRGGAWTSFIARFYDELQGRDSFTRIHAAEDGTLWAGSQGSAVASVSATDEISIFDQTNSSIRAPEGSENSSFILIGGIDSDPSGNVWVSSRQSALPLNVQGTDGTWTGMPLKECGGLTFSRGTYDRLFVDSFGQIWIDIKSRGNLQQALGLVVLNPMGTPADPSDDVCRFFGETGAAGSGLPGLEVFAVEEDHGGLTWIATDRGLAYFVNNGLVAHDASSTAIWPQHDDRSRGVFMFQGLQVNDVAVDPANQLWVATDAGAWLIRPQGSGFEEVEHFQSSNSPLLSDVVVAVTVDDETGWVFFATDRGLVSYQGEAIAASPRPGNLLVYPNPVRLAPDEEPAIYIEGLVDQTEIMILAPQGELIDRFMARGGRARWDGRDRSGRLVPSGMYMVVAIGQNGEETAYGKVGIVR